MNQNGINMEENDTRLAYLRIRPGNPHNGGRLTCEDFFNIYVSARVVFEEGIIVSAINDNVVILRNNSFCVVIRDLTILGEVKEIGICLPGNIGERRVIFSLTENNYNMDRVYSG